MAYLGFCKTLMGGSRQSRAIFGHFLILSITHKIIVAHLQLAFPSTTHLLHCPILPIWSAKVNTEVHGTEANNKQLQAWEHLPFGRSLQHRTMGSLYVSDPWLKCESFKKTFKTGEETPLTFKREKKRVDLLSLLHDQKKDNTWRNGGILKRWYLYKGCIKGKATEGNNRQRLPFKGIAVAPPHSIFTVAL